MSTAVLDASAVLRGTSPEPEAAASAWLDAIMSGRWRALAPDLVQLEMANALAMQARTGPLGADDVREWLALALGVPLELTSGRALVVDAFEVALRSALSVYDACYAVLAEAHDAVLVTADRRLAAAAPRSALLPDVGPEAVFGLPGQGD